MDAFTELPEDLFQELVSRTGVYNIDYKKVTSLYQNLFATYFIPGRDINSTPLIFLDRSSHDALVEEIKRLSSNDSLYFASNQYYERIARIHFYIDENNTVHKIQDYLMFEIFLGKYYKLAAIVRSTEKGNVSFFRVASNYVQMFLSTDFTLFNIDTPDLSIPPIAPTMVIYVSK